jgi:hypothetical protein
LLYMSKLRNGPLPQLFSYTKAIRSPSKNRRIEIISQIIQQQFYLENSLC